MEEDKKKDGLSSPLGDRNFIYLLNPKSGTQKKDLIVKLIEKETTALNIPFEILHTNAEGNYEFIKDKIVDKNITDVIIIGGDGTVNQVTNALKRCNVNFGIIPIGSGNGLARAAHIPMKTKAALALMHKWHTIFLQKQHEDCLP